MHQEDKDAVYDYLSSLKDTDTPKQAMMQKGRGMMRKGEIGEMWISLFITLIVILFVVFIVFGRRGYRPLWDEESGNQYRHEKKETPLEILKKRYAKGEISKEEFEEMKRVLLK